MKQIVHWQIVMVIVTIGTYAAVLAGGGSELTAFATALVVAALAAAFATLAAALAAFAAFAALAAFAVATAFAATVFATAVFAAAVFAAAVFAAAFAATAATAELNITRRWAFAAYGIEGAAIFGALVLGSVGWAVAIGAVAVVALLAVWKFGPVAAPVAAVPRGDDERELDHRITETERTLADLRAQRAALDASSAGTTFPRKCGV